MENLRICLLQMDIAWELPEQNRARIDSMLSDEAGKHDLIVLPEMFTTGFTMEAAAVAEKPGGVTEQWMQELANRMGAVVTGSLVVEDGGLYFNRLLVVHAGGTAMHYDKRHLFRMAGEHETYSAGQAIMAFTVKGWRVLPLICYDLRFPVWSRNKLQDDGRMYYDLALFVANWPERRNHHWKTLLSARAIENQSFVAGVNRVGSDGKGIPYSGDTTLLDPMGQPLAYGSRQPMLLKATLDWQNLIQYRDQFPAWRDADRFDLYS